MNTINTNFTHTAHGGGSCGPAAKGEKMNQIIENLNYYNDHRVKNYADNWYSVLNTKKMLAYSYLADDPDSSEWCGDVEDWIPFVWVVCPTCEGRGTHTNPAIDCNGLTADDFAEDIGFAENYCSGVYDQRCNKCGGRRVVPELGDDKYRHRLERYLKEIGA